MKKMFLLLLLVTVCKLSWSQNANLEYKHAFKVYNLTSYEEYSQASFNMNETKTSLQILHPSFAYQWMNDKKNAHEVELTYFKLGKLTSEPSNLDTLYRASQNANGDIFSTVMAIRYEYILNFNKSKEKNLVPSLGFAINPYYTQTSYKPVISTDFENSEIYTGAKVFVTPRLTYYIGSKFFVEVNLPLCFSNIYYSEGKTENPLIPIDERNTSSLNIETLPKVFTGRIGIGLRL